MITYQVTNKELNENAAKRNDIVLFIEAAFSWPTMAIAASVQQILSNKQALRSISRKKFLFNSSNLA